MFETESNDAQFEKIRNYMYCKIICEILFHQDFIMTV
jgi:hypothetical protein